MIVIGIVGALFFWVAEAAIHVLLYEEASFLDEVVPRDAHELWMRLFVCVQFVAFGAYAHRVVSRLRRTEVERRQLSQRLEEALTKALSGFVPICTACKSVRSEDEKWVPVDSYITSRTDATFSHTVCPGCAKELYPGYA